MTHTGHDPSPADWVPLHGWPDSTVDDLDGPGMLPEPVAAPTTESPLDPQAAVRVVEGLNAAVVVLAADGICTYANPAAARLLGHDRNSLLDADVYRTIRPTRDPNCPIAATFADGVARTAIPDVFATATATVPVLVTVDPFVVDGIVTRVVVTATDATTQMQALLAEHEAAEVRQLAVERLQHVTEQKTDFVYTVSHELRTPITAVLGYLELAAEEPDLSDDVIDYLEVATRNAHRLLAHVEALLMVSRIESSGTANINPATAADVADVVGTVVDNLSGLAANKSVTVTTDIADGITARIDPFQLEQVVTNLTANAVKFTPSGGQVQVRSWVTDAGVVHLEVEDSGVGVPLEDLPHIFEKFYRAQKARTDAVPGTGLGLAIVKAIVTTHGGQVAAISREGVGTVFAATLPAAR